MARKYIAARVTPPGRLAPPSGFVPPEPEDDFCGTAARSAGQPVGGMTLAAVHAPEPANIAVEPPVSLPADPRKLTEAEAALLPPDPYAEAARAAMIRKYGPDAGARAFQAGGSRPHESKAWHEKRATVTLAQPVGSPAALHVADDGLLRAKIVMEGKRAEREISGARMAAHTAWDTWRNIDVFKVRDPRTGDERTVFQPNHPARHTQGARYVPSHDESGNLVMIEELCYSLDGNDEGYPDLLALREAAEAADRRVLELQDQVDIMRALNPVLAKRSRR
jgi:hypothetical protein